MMKRSAIIEACNCNCLISHMPKVIASFPPFRGIPLATCAIHMATPFSVRAERAAEATRARANVLVASLVQSTSDDARSDALDQLNSVADHSYGADAAALAAAVRESGGIRALIACINSYDGDPTKCDELPQGALALIGNLLTDVFDPEADLSLAAFIEQDGLDSLQGVLRRDERGIQLYVCAVLQNATSLDPDALCQTLRSRGLMADLAPLLSSNNETLASYATAVLANLRAHDPYPVADGALDEAIRRRRLVAIVEQMRSGKAIDIVQRAATRWVNRRASTVRLQAAARGRRVRRGQFEKLEAKRRVAAARAEAEAERVAAEKAEAERVATEKAEAERVAAEKSEAEREKTGTALVRLSHSASGTLQTIKRSASFVFAPLRSASTSALSAIKSSASAFSPSKQAPASRFAGRNLSAVSPAPDESVTTPIEPIRDLYGSSPSPHGRRHRTAVNPPGDGSVPEWSP